MNRIEVKHFENLGYYITAINGLTEDSTNSLYWAFGRRIPEGDCLYPVGKYPTPEGDCLYPVGKCSTPEGDCLYPVGKYSTPEGDYL